MKENISNFYKDLPVGEQPDFIIIPDSVLITSGSFRRLSQFGMPGSVFQQEVLKKYPGKSYLEIFKPFDCLVLKDNSLVCFLTWLISCLKGAGARSTPLELYLEAGKIFGHRL